MLIGLMGKSGCGKTTISLLFKEWIPTLHIVEIDKIGHASHHDPVVKQKIFNYFGAEVFNEDHTINRNILSSIVYHDPAMMQKLYKATNQFIEKQILASIKEDAVNLLDYALLPKSKIFAKCDVTILVECPYEIRCKRAMQRDRISKKKYEERDKNSLDYSSFQIDYKITNDGNIDHLRKEIGDIYESSILSRKF